MEVVVVDGEEKAGLVVADIFCRALASRERPTFGVATGGSPLPTYAELIRRHREEGLSFAGASAFLLDEYLGLSEGHPGLYRTFIKEVFAEGVGLPADRLFGPQVHGVRADAACAEYEERIERAGGIDVQLLGIGGDGHIGFNEPSSSLTSRTRIKTLTQETREDNARFFGGDVEAVPMHVVTMGIGTIMEARHLVLVATGEGKAECLARAIEGPLTARVPASVLQMHPHVTVVADEAAASGLELLEYYKETYRGKPDWQSC